MDGKGAATPSRHAHTRHTKASDVCRLACLVCLVLARRLPSGVLYFLPGYSNDTILPELTDRQTSKA